MPEYRAQDIDQRDANNKKTNGKMQLHVRHNQHGSRLSGTGSRGLQHPGHKWGTQGMPGLSFGHKQ
jgi:hypothetical protein